MSLSHDYDMSVFVLQGGGALGSYQVGVMEGLSNRGCKPDWIIGTSIGAINAAIIAGNKPEDRINKLKEFWKIIETPAISFPTLPYTHIRKLQNFWSSYWTMCFGQPGFFTPSMMNAFQQFERTPDKIGFYDTAQLRLTLESVIDFDIINQQTTRLSLCAVCIEDGQMVYFDNTRQTIDASHVMASGALPPGFPAIKIDDKHYWDGGVSSNTPFQLVLNEKIPQKIMCFMVNLFPNEENLPLTMLDVMKRRKDIQYASRYHQVLHAFCEIHRLQHKIHKVCEIHKPEQRSKELDELCQFAHPSALNIIRFQYKDKPYDLCSTDFEFSNKSLQEHYQAGIEDVAAALITPTWLELIADDAGIVLHEF